MFLVLRNISIDSNINDVLVFEKIFQKNTNRFSQGSKTKFFRVSDSSRASVVDDDIRFANFT